MLSWFAARPIRQKLTIAYAASFVLLLLVGGFVTDVMMRRNLERGMEEELRNSTTVLLNLLESSLNSTIRSYLRGIAEQDLKMVADLEAQAARGEISGAEARERARALLGAQHIGKTGYTCVLDSGGTMRVHPKPAMVDRNLSEYAFVREITSRKEGYFEYEWQNPDDRDPRPKAMYMTYFAPWDWIILASAYRNEFGDLLQMDDLRSTVLSMRKGRTGYSFITNMEGDILVHPTYEGRNIHDMEGQSIGFFEEMKKEQSGRQIYEWKNAGEAKPVRKLLIYSRLPGFNWIVASATNLDEIYEPLNGVRNLFLLFISVSLTVLLVVTFRIGRGITTPIQALAARLGRARAGLLADEERPETRDEVANLARLFDLYLARLDVEIVERRQAEKALENSEEMFRKAFRASPYGLCILRASDGKVLHVNEAFREITGWETGDASPEGAGNTGWRGEILHNAAPRSVREVACGPGVDGGERLALVSTERLEIWDEECVLVTVEEITERRWLERKVVESGDSERARIGRELHDDLAPHLAGIEVLCKVLYERLAAGKVQDTSSVEVMRRLISEATFKVRSMARGLCPLHLSDNQFEMTLREISSQIETIHGIKCEVSTPPSLPRLDPSTAAQLIFILRESLHNAVKHSGAKAITITAAESGGALWMTVRDDGVGFDSSAKGTGMGLRIMKYRAAMIGAGLEITVGPEGGTSVTITTAPLKDDETL